MESASVTREILKKAANPEIKPLAVYTKIKYIRMPLLSKIPYPIVNRVRFEITTHETGLKSYKPPQEEADRIECVLKSGLQFTM